MAWSGTVASSSSDKSSARSAAMTKSLGGAQLAGGFPGNIERHQSLGGGAQIAAGVPQHPLDPPNRHVRRVVGDKVTHQFGGQEPVGGRVVGEEVERRQA